jgi:hypothetical protein
MRALALLIGNSDYPSRSSKLFNAANDASSMGEALEKLGFDIKLVTNAPILQIDEAVSEFGNELSSYDIGLFFYAGHGFQDAGENYLSAIDTSFTIVSTVRTSLALKNVLGYMDRAENSTNIVILDACREDLFNIIERARSTISTTTLAPVYAPKGTIIAFSTSPGEKASDGTKASGNGLYTRALLEHLETPKLSIEEFFKRVRNSVSSFSIGRQTTWEHTSLTGNFSFNSGIITHASEDKYSADAIVDNKYVTGKDELSSIINSLKSHTWETQNDAIIAISKLSGVFDDDAFFVLGRNIVQAAEGGAFKAENYMNNLSHKLAKFDKSAAEPVLDGMLFEVYFNSDGKVRDQPKSSYLNELLNLKDNDEYKASFDFIDQQLQPHSEKVFLIPGDADTIKTVEVFLEKEKIHFSKNEDDFYTRFLVKSIAFEGETIMTDDDGSDNFRSHHEELDYDRFCTKLSAQLGIPKDRLKIITNLDVDDSPIAYLWGVKLKRRGRR